MKKIAVFASGNGTNAENITRYFSDHHSLHIDSIWTNNPSAGVIQRMANYDCPVLLFTRREMQEGVLLEKLQSRAIDGIVLAGFLLLIPPSLVTAFPRQILNIHPALLPKYGGKGMYGSRVHEAVYAEGDKETGITIHYVDKHYDEGAVIFQVKVALDHQEVPERIAQKVHELEFEHYPKVIEQIFSSHV